MGLEELTLGYIRRCDEILKAQDINEAKELLELIISAFGDYISGIKNGLDRYGVIAKYGGDIDYLGDITKLKAKLEIFHATECRPTKVIINPRGNGDINIHNNNQNSNNNTNTNTVNNDLEISILFDEAKAKVESDENLSEPEIEEVLEKIEEIKGIYESGETKNKKWFKLRPTMEWLGTKGLNTATTILNLITAIIKYKS